MGIIGSIVVSDQNQEILIYLSSEPRIQLIIKKYNINIILILTISFGIIILFNVPVTVFAQHSNGPRINWREICENPIVHILVSQPCSSLTSYDGYTLTKEGERVLLCIAGGAVSILIGKPQLIALKNQVGCGDNPSSSSQTFDRHSSTDDGALGNIISSLFK